jgi:hypothetical protein
MFMGNNYSRCQFQSLIEWPRNRKLGSEPDARAARATESGAQARYRGHSPSEPRLGKPESIKLSAGAR